MGQFKIINKRERYGLTWLGWAGFLSTIIISFIICLLSVHPFLATTARVEAEIMVVEGWLPDYALKKVMLDFQNGSYKILITTGGPIERGSYLEKYNTQAELAAATLLKIGFDSNKLIAISTPAVQHDRTYASAIEVKNWIINSGLNIDGLNIYSLGPHSRRSRLLYHYVFSPDIMVGIIAIDSINYNSKKWWKTSSGVRTVFSETIAYIYAKFFFSPN